MAKKDPTSPATTSAAYDVMEPRWALMDALLGGTDAMRAAGERFCPKHEEETDLSYEARLAGAVLYNMTEQTLDSLAGKPFSAPIKLSKDVPAIIAGTPENPAAGFADDIDLQGNNLHVFCRKWFREGLAKAFCHVLVDLPPPAAPAVEGQPRTLADDRREGRRPFWVLVKPEAVLFARAEVVNGREVLQHVRIMESYMKQTGFAEVCQRRIRVLDVGRVTLYEPHPTKKKDGEEVWEQTDTWETGLDFIPMVTFYADRDEFMVGKPPLYDLAQLNVTHWQSTSEQRHILRVARFPILACSGASATDSDPVVVGPNKVLYNEDPQGKFYYVEHTGKSIEAGRVDLEDLERQMESYGGQFVRKKPGSETATAKAIDSAEETSDLASMAGLFEDAVAQALYLTVRLAGGTAGTNATGGSVELVKNYTQTADDGKNLEALIKVREAKDISRYAIIEALRQRGALPEDFDAELDAERLLEEMDDLMARSGLDLDPAAPKPGKPAAPGDGGEEDEGEEEEDDEPEA